MRHKINSIAQKLRLPAICGLCNQYYRSPLAICNECLALITPLGPACRQCAMPLPDDNHLLCGHCCQKKPWIDTVITAWRYEEPLRSLLHEFKYREGLHLVTLLSTLMMHALPAGGYTTECLVPVPMHPKRLRQRGFNQAAELTKHLGRRLAVPYELTLCKKIINTTPQAGLNAAERRRNLQRVFQANPGNYRHITLVDDLLTTGSTANELARVLKQHGVERVDLWCCARVANQTGVE